MKKIAFTWGWTWWHITPIISIYNTIKDNADFFWIWEKDSLEEKIAKDNWIKFYNIKSWKLRRYFSFKTFIEPINIFSWIISSIKILKKEKPDIIFSKWWYVSLPVAIASKILHIPLYLHESDTIPWLANRLVSRFASKIYLWFIWAKKFFKSKNIEIVWQILNPNLFDLNYQDINFNNDKTTILVTWWSQWSKRIYSKILENIENLNDFNLIIVLWSANTDMKEQFPIRDNIKIYWFIEQTEFKSLMRISDIAITRAWATSLAELLSFWLKLIMIPLKESANNHQYFNALEYQNEWKWIMIEEKDLNQLSKTILKYKWFKKEINISAINKATQIISTELLK